jgi:hypothetical protein
MVATIEAGERTVERDPRGRRRGRCRCRGLRPVRNRCGAILCARRVTQRAGPPSRRHTQSSASTR